MKKQLVIGFIFLAIGFLLGFVSWSIAESNKSPEQIIDSLEKAIVRAEEKGNYRCCIEPACTMCYLGDWKFDKGTCDCDSAIAEGRNDDVCPQCKKGIEKGQCRSTTESCELSELMFEAYT